MIFFQQARPRNPQPSRIFKCQSDQFGEFRGGDRVLPAVRPSPKWLNVISRLTPELFQVSFPALDAASSATPVRNPWEILGRVVADFHMASQPAPGFLFRFRDGRIGIKRLWFHLSLLAAIVSDRMGLATGSNDAMRRR